MFHLSLLLHILGICYILFLLYEKIFDRINYEYLDIFLYHYTFTLLMNLEMEYHKNLLLSFTTSSVMDLQGKTIYCKHRRLYFINFKYCEYLKHIF